MTIPKTNNIKEVSLYTWDETLGKYVALVDHQTDGEQKTVIQTLGEDVGVQNPFPVDGDSVYEKDINGGVSTSGTFAGDVKDLFNSYDEGDILVDTSSTNPEIF